MAQESTKPQPKISDKPMTPEQLAVYHALLTGWMGNGKHSVHLSILTTPYERADPDSDCGKGLNLEDVAKGISHRFRTEDLPQLGSNKIGLVDPELQAAEVDANNPHKHIQSGKPIGEAVANGFAHGLVTLSEIRFDKSHTHAILWYGFTCGSLCGNGGTVILEKNKGIWTNKRQCSNWISQQRILSNQAEGE